jgi:hypothetical protein
MKPFIFFLALITINSCGKININGDDDDDDDFPFTKTEFSENIVGTWSNCIEDDLDDGTFLSVRIVIEEDLGFEFRQGNTHQVNDCSDYPIGGYLKSEGTIEVTDTERGDLDYGNGFNVEATYASVELKVETALTGFYGADLNNFPSAFGGDDNTPFCDELDPGNVTWTNDTYGSIAGCDDLTSILGATFAAVSSVNKNILSLSSDGEILYIGLDSPLIVSTDVFPSDVASAEFNKQ